MLYPILDALRLSFFEAGGFGTPEFIGLGNYRQLLEDPRYLKALENTTIYTLASIFILSPIALILAVTIRSFVVPWATFKSFYRLTFFLPFITSLVVVALMFNVVFDPNYGLLNAFLTSIGLPQLGWLRSPDLALPSVIMVGIWTYVGINSLYFLAGLQNIPDELHEAAAVDGAGRVKTFFYVTLPLLKPVILFVVVQATIFSYQLFELPFLLTGGGPSDATLTLAIYLYETGFRQFDRGYASAIGYSMALIAIAIAATQLYLYRRLER
ncbi:sugar ABC transporter permease [Rubrobacter taiwanensis]|uniref:Sugar ABC transporter permease n=2 Tax=Rubrobacter taiwanensis TaxID=185139 RepID=A0A4R1BES8_9ACTN|nr:sugar ABC transporter permease [Rubrobacter taiwanensis]